MERAEWKEYRDCVAALLAAPEVARLKTIRHHPGVSCYEHSAFVSYVAWRLARRWWADGALAARAGLLHDLYLYDPRSLPSWRQCFAHPVAAARNAAALRGGLSAIIQRGAPCPRSGRRWDGPFRALFCGWG